MRIFKVDLPAETSLDNIRHKGSFVTDPRMLADCVLCIMFAVILSQEQFHFDVLKW